MATPIYNSPELAMNSASAYLAHNLALRQIEAINSSVLNAIVNTPPLTPNQGDAYILSPTPTGVWALYPDHIAFWASGWVFVPPYAGMPPIYDRTTKFSYAYDGTVWQLLQPYKLVGATATLVLNTQHWIGNSPTVVLTLPTLGLVAGSWVRVLRTTHGTSVTINSGAGSFSLPGTHSADIVYDGGSWRAVSFATNAETVF
jgi:hypothetical protein